MKSLIPFALVAIFGVSLSIAAEVPATSTSPWAVHNPNSTSAPNHQALNDLIKVFGKTNKSYTAIDFNAMKGRGVDYVGAYLAGLQTMPISLLNRDEQLAYWLNLHNTGVMYLLAARKTPRKLDKYRSTPGAPGEWWQEQMFNVEGHALSLEQIEQDVLQQHWSDSLFVYGLYDGSKSGPDLGAQAFTGSLVHSQLEEAARKFINDDKRVDINRRGELTLSSLYEWRKPSFGDDDSAVLQHLMSYAQPELAERLAETKAVGKHRFDWSIVRHSIRRAPLDQDSYNNAGYGGGVGGGS
jgi:hypothetical protein